MARDQLARDRQADDAAADDREVAALGRRRRGGSVLGTARRLPGDRAGPARRGRRGGVHEAGAVEAFVAAAAELARGGAQARGDLRRAWGARPSTPLAMISAAVAATCGVAIDVPS